MQKFTKMPYLLLIFFLVGLTIVITCDFSQGFSAKAEQKTSANAPREIPLEIAREQRNCSEGNIECLQRKIFRLDGQIRHYRQQESWQDVGRLQQVKAGIHNKLGEFPQAIAVLCGESAQDGASDELPTCEKDSAIANARENSRDEMMAWGFLAESYRLNRNDERAVLGVEKFEAMRSEICTQEECSPHQQKTLLDIAAKTYRDRGERYEQRARLYREADIKEKVAEFQGKAEKDRNSTLERLETRLQIAATVEEQAGVWLKRLQVYENRVQALLDEIPVRLFSEEEKSEEAARQHQIALAIADRQTAIARIQTLYPQLPDSRIKFDIALSLGSLAVRHPPQLALNDFSIPSAAFFSHQCHPRFLGEARSRELLQDARSLAQQWGDNWLKSFAIGELGHLEECAGNLDRAWNYTDEARKVAEGFFESEYLWHWQRGRIFWADGNPGQARYAYGKAISTLERLRSQQPSKGLAEIIDRYSWDWQLDFRDRVSPLYREYARLLLEKAKTLPLNSEKREELFADAEDAIEALQLVNFEIYFGERCSPTKSREEMMRELLERKTAIFRFMVLGKKTAIIVKRFQQPSQLTWIETQELKTCIRYFKEINQRCLDLEDSLYKAQELYELIFTPFLQDETLKDIETLVFVQDELFNNIPLAALYDGEKYLVEKYAIAILPGLSFTQPKARNSRNRILAFGLTEASQLEGEEKPQKALAYVESELSTIKAEFPNTEKFLNPDFSRETLERELDRQTYKTLHIATHARFGTGADDTFLIMGAKNPSTQTNEKLTLRNLTKILEARSQKPQLLVLSACETGKGDNRLNLGLGGIALRSGVPTTVASLWLVDDEATQELMVTFYNQLKEGRGVAYALQQAQIELIEQDDKNHPYYWAAFIAIGNWL